MTWILKHADGHYLENVFCPDEAEPVAAFRDVPQRMAIRFGHRMAAKDTAQIIFERLGERFRVVRLRTLRAKHKAVASALIKDAAHWCHRAKREAVRTTALGSVLQAATDLFDLGDRDEARLVLAAGRRTFINGLRETVSNEPGGLAWAARSESKSNP